MLGIGNLDRVNRRKVVTREGQKLYMGKKYAIEQKTGYYVCTSGSRRRLHDIMWEHENIAGIKNIPEGYVIHHIDWNKTHNEINNLTCISVFGHNLIHNPPKKRKRICSRDCTRWCKQSHTHLTLGVYYDIIFIVNIFVWCFTDV